MSSDMPTDKSPTLGLNYGMDGYPDDDYGEGLEHDLSLGMGALDGLLDDGAGLTSIPDGFARAAEGLGDLSHVVRDAALTDLSWLDVSEQDLERMPKAPHATAIPELEAQWSKHRGDPGIHFHANVDLDVAQYRASLKENTRKRLPKKVLREAIRKAMRLSTMGHPLKEISEQVNQVILASGAERNGGLHEDDEAILTQALSEVAEEHGLAGRVFVRAEAFPGYESGRWDKVLRKHASGARYIVVPKNKLQAAHHHDGWCSVTKKRAVAEVPWTQARKIYAPILAATGRTVRASGDPRAALKSAFAQQAQGFEEVPQEFPRHVAPSERVSLSEAAKTLAGASLERERITLAAQEDARARRKAQVKVARWVQEGLLDRKIGARLVSSEAEPHEMLRRAAAHITKMPESEQFTGIFNEDVALPKLAEDIARERLQRAEDPARNATEKVRKLAAEKVRASSRAAKKEAAVRAKVAKVVAQIEKGMRGQVLANVLRRTFAADEVEIAGPLLDPVLKQSNALAEPSPKARGFTGIPYVEAPMARAASLTPSPKEVQGLIRWARLKLAEGVMGDEFDTLLKLRFAKGIRKAAAEPLQALRDEHEGLSGNMYVDAAAYASREGTEGCEKGALIHRANGIRNVLAMDRCKGCAFANTLPDGNQVCSKYSKTLVDGVPVADKRAAQREAIRLANASDAERTASLFSPAYDPGEFGLQNDTLDSFAYSTSTEKLGEVLFGDTLSGYLSEE